MSSKGSCLPKDGRHRHVRSFSDFLFHFIQPQAFVPRELVRSEGASILTHSGSKRNRDRCSISGGLPICQFFEVYFDGFEGAAITQQPIPFHFFSQLCSNNHVCFCWDTIQVGESSCMWFWCLTLYEVPLSSYAKGGQIFSCSGNLNGCQITRGGFKRDA